MKRRTHEFPGFDLNRLNNRWSLKVPLGAALVVAARLEAGTWATATLSVKRIVGGAGPEDFTSAKSIAEGGGVCPVSSIEMEGTEEVEIRLTGGVEASGSRACVSVTVEEQ